MLLDKTCPSAVQNHSLVVLAVMISALGSLGSTCTIHHAQIWNKLLIRLSLTAEPAPGFQPPKTTAFWLHQGESLCRLLLTPRVSCCIQRCSSLKLGTMEGIH